MRQDHSATSLLTFLATTSPETTAELLQKLIGCIQAMFDCAESNPRSPFAKHMAANSKGYVPLEFILKQPAILQQLNSYAVTIPESEVATLSHYLRMQIKNRPCRLWANPCGVRRIRPEQPKKYPPILIENFDTQNNYQDFEALLQSVCEVKRIDYDHYLNSATVYTATPDRLLALEGYYWPNCNLRMRVSLYEEAWKKMRDSAALLNIVHHPQSVSLRRKNDPYPCMRHKYEGRGRRHQMGRMEVGLREEDFEQAEEMTEKEYQAWRERMVEEELRMFDQDGNLRENS